MRDLLGRLKRTEHHFCQENLSSYLDGQLSPRAYERVERHLQGCESCRWDLESLRRTVALLRAMPRAKAPRSFAIPESAPAPSVPFWMRPGTYAVLRTATATVAALFVITVAGRALAVPAPRMTMLAHGKAAATAAAQLPEAAPAAMSGEALPNDTPVASLMAPAAATPAPAAAQPTGPIALGEPTLTPEEQARRAAAPLGKGGDVGAQPTADSVRTPNGRGVAGTPPVPTQAAEVAPSTPDESMEAMGGQAALPEPAPEDGRARQPFTVRALRDARRQLAAYPWQALMAATAAALALLVAATLWLRSARAHWP